MSFANMTMNCSRTFLTLSSILRSTIINKGRFIFCYRCPYSKGFSSISKDGLYPVLQPFTASVSTSRHYAKGKDKKKSEKGKKKVNIDERILDGIVDVVTFHTQLQNAVELLQDDYVKNLSLRSTSGAVETLTVKFDGKEYKMQELAQVIRQNPKSIILNVSSFPQAIPAILEAIEKSGMNLNPQQDGTKLFIPVPKVTKELRESLAKNAKAMFIRCKGNLKDIQTKYIKTVKVKENNGLSKDLSRNATDQITAICDDYVAQAEKIFQLKESELIGQ